MFFSVSAGLSARAEDGGAFKTYRDAKYGFSFSYPDNLSVVVSTAPRGDLRRIVIMNGRCAAGDLRLVRADKEKVVLPKRPSFPTYDRKRNMWMEAGEETGGLEPVCIAPEILKSGLTAYTHTDAMHGWCSAVVLANNGTAFIWTNTPHSDGAICEFDPKALLSISRTLAFSGDLKSIVSRCPESE